MTISGARSAVERFEFWQTEPLEAEGVYKTLEGKITLADAEKANILFSKTEISYTIPVEEFTGKNLDIPISIYSETKVDSIDVFPTKVTLTCEVPLSKFETISASQFSAIVDVSTIEDSITRVVPVEIGRKPDFIRNVRFTPSTVEFFFNKQDD